MTAVVFFILGFSSAHCLHSVAQVWLLPWLQRRAAERWIQGQRVGEVQGPYRSGGIKFTTIELSETQRQLLSVGEPAASNFLADGRPPPTSIPGPGRPVQE